ncbi:MAG: tRNA adenosine deaminase-associated protein [Micromonosporaceae bacterium]|nr:tRNA adenosine deaminase-associated protein [Micromonosporaceae bacterium]
MSYFAAAVVRGSKGWEASELDLTGAADVEEVADRLRDVDPEADVSLLFVESDDAYLVIMRLDQGEDLRIFGSDAAFAEESRLGALLLGEVEEPALRIEDVTTAAAANVAEEAEGPRGAAGPLDADIDPVGDADLLADLGVSSRQLLALCATEGMLPADITAELGQLIGFGDEIEDLREVA